jgi:hypothetical protein
MATVDEHADDNGLAAGDVVVVTDDADADWWWGDASKAVEAFPLNHTEVNAAVGGVVVALQAFVGPELGDLISSWSGMSGKYLVLLNYQISK